jgi:hypothetical protein
MKQPQVQHKKDFLHDFADYSKEDLIKEIIFYQKDQRSLQNRANKYLIKVDKKLTILVWFLTVIPILFAFILYSKL